MSVRTDKNYHKASGLHVNAATVNKTSANIIKLEFESPEEVIDCLIRAYPETGKRLTRRKLNLMMTARRELTSELYQVMLYSDVLLMQTTSSAAGW